MEAIRSQGINRTRIGVLTTMSVTKTVKVTEVYYVSLDVPEGIDPASQCKDEIENNEIILDFDMFSHREYQEIED